MRRRLSTLSFRHRIVGFVHLIPFALLLLVAAGTASAMRPADDGQQALSAPSSAQPLPTLPAHPASSGGTGSLLRSQNPLTRLRRAHARYSARHQRLHLRKHRRRAVRRHRHRPRSFLVTHVSTTTYTSNTTWTLANSPYVLDGNITVASGVTLTIEPGVIVKFNGSLRRLIVNGNLSAVGTQTSPITFTSYQDDSAGGDTNGDGNATSGAPGQWYDIESSNTTGTTTLIFVNIRYGGNGSAANYAPIYLYGSGRSATLNHVTITNNQRSAVVAANRASATISNSTLSNNHDGLYVDTATATVDHSTIANNSSRGVWFNLPTVSPAPATSSVTTSDITGNTSFGVYVGANGDYPLASLPIGTGNNIYTNNVNAVQLDVVGGPTFKNADVNWRGNYWGNGVYYWYGAGSCGGTSPNSPGHLAYRSSGGNVPAGPISSGSYLIGSSWCGYDSFKFGTCDFYTARLDTGVYNPWCATLGSIDAKNPTATLGGDVNSATGGFTHTESDLSLPGTGVGLSFTRTYNSLNLTKGDLGQGWSDSLSASLTIRANGDVRLRAEDGQQLDYVKQPDGSFIGPSSTTSRLASSGGGYDLTRTDQVKYHFDSQGRLTSMVDRNGQGLGLSYGGDGKLATVTDAAARTITFTHDGNGLLTGIAMPDGTSVSYGYTSGQLTSYTDQRGKIWSYTYDSHGFLASETDPLGHTQFQNTYGNDGRVTQQVDALNHTTTFSWDQATQTQTVTDPRGNVSKDVYANNVLTTRIDPLSDATQVGHDSSLDQTSVASPTGATTTMTYDSRGNLLTKTGPASLGSPTTTFAYDSTNDVTSTTDARGKVTTYGYDANGNNTSIVQDGQTISQSTYNSVGQLTSSTDGAGHTTTRTYDANGNLSSSTDPLGNKTSYTYDAAGRVLTKTDPRGNVPGANPADFTTTYTYDATGHQLSEADPLGNATTYTYDAAGNKISSTEPRGNTTTYAYDAANRLVSTTGPDPDGAGPLQAPVTTSTYDAAGNQVTVTDPLGHATTKTYDSNNRVASVTTPKGEETTYGYDADGNLVSTVDPRGNVSGANPSDYTTTRAYDADRRLLSETDPLGHSTTYGYDNVGNRTSVTDANNHSTSYTYDAAGRVLTVTAPDGGTTAYTYDGNGNKLARTDANNHTTTDAYDSAGRLVSVTGPDPDGSGPLSAPLTSYGYDAAGNRTSTIDPNGNATPASGDGTTSYTYDADNRLTAIAYSDSTPNVSFSYDAASNRASMTDGEGTVSYVYDNLGRLTTSTRGTDSFSYAYDAVGNITSRTYPDGTVTSYGYDEDERLASATSGVATTSYTYDAAGNLTQTTLPSGNGYAETRTYDRAGRLVELKNANGPFVLSDFAYTVDPVGNPTTVTQTGAASSTTTYSYDANDRLTSVCFQATCPGGADPFIRWTYDGVGNRLSETRPSGTTTYTYNNDDELLSAGPTSYSYDANGNETAAGSRTFSYDLANRMVSTSDGGTTTTYRYDGDGNRLQTSTGSQAAEQTNYLWDTNGLFPQLALERDGNNALIRRYVYGIRRISMASGGNVYYYLYDELGTVVNVSSSTGAIEWTYAYEPFGGLRNETQNDSQAPANPMKFAGELLDQTGLYYLRAREYDPNDGRFLLEDPAGSSAGEVCISSYVYAKDRPSVLLDPSGANTVWGNCGKGWFYIFHRLGTHKITISVGFNLHFPYVPVLLHTASYWVRGELGTFLPEFQRGVGPLDGYFLLLRHFTVPPGHYWGQAFLTATTPVGTCTSYPLFDDDYVP